MYDSKTGIWYTRRLGSYDRLALKTIASREATNGWCALAGISLFSAFISCLVLAVSRIANAAGAIYAVFAFISIVSWIVLVILIVIAYVAAGLEGHRAKLRHDGSALSSSHPANVLFVVKLSSEKFFAKEHDLINSAVMNYSRLQRQYDDEFWFLQRKHAETWLTIRRLYINEIVWLGYAKADDMNERFDVVESGLWKQLRDINAEKVGDARSTLMDLEVEQSKYVTLTPMQ